MNITGEKNETVNSVDNASTSPIQVSHVIEKNDDKTCEPISEVDGNTKQQFLHVPSEESNESSLQNQITQLKEEIQQLRRDQFKDRTQIGRLECEFEKLRQIVERVVKSENVDRKSRGCRLRRLPLVSMDCVDINRVNAWKDSRKTYSVRYWKDNDIRREEIREVTFDYATFMTTERFHAMSCQSAMTKLAKFVMIEVLRHEFMWQYSDSESPREYLRLPSGLIDDITLALYIGCGGEINADFIPMEKETFSSLKENIVILLHDRLTRMHPKGRETVAERAKKMQRQFQNFLVESAKNEKKRRREPSLSSLSSNSSLKSNEYEVTTRKTKKKHLRKEAKK